jgi:hypothetical protein
MRIRPDLKGADCKTYLHVSSCPHWAKAMDYIAKGNSQALARNPDIEGAISSFRQAQVLYPALSALDFPSITSTK